MASETEPYACIVCMKTMPEVDALASRGCRCTDTAASKMCSFCISRVLTCPLCKDPLAEDVRKAAQERTVRLVVSTSLAKFEGVVDALKKENWWDFEDSCPKPDVRVADCVAGEWSWEEGKGFECKDGMVGLPTKFLALCDALKKSSQQNTNLVNRMHETYAKVDREAKMKLAAIRAEREALERYRRLAVRRAAGGDGDGDRDASDASDASDAGRVGEVAGAADARAYETYVDQLALDDIDD